jgi:hypothetical protein
VRAVSDGALLAFGCGVFFLSLAGAYVAIRGRFWEHEEHPVVETRRGSGRR